MTLSDGKMAVNWGIHWIAGRDCRISYEDDDDNLKTYRRILRLFQDTKMATYSIHQMAQMGVSEGKEVGQWFGPNTVAQVLKYCHFIDVPSF